jgi:site-specific recombinase XerD
VLRHTFATQLVRDGHDLVLVADLLGHADLGSTRVYTQSTQSTHDDRAAALGALLIDG